MSEKDAGVKAGRSAAGERWWCVPINYFLYSDLRSPSSLNVVINQVFSWGRDISATGFGKLG